MTKYFTMMAVRVACFVLMVVITPYGWYTWVLAVGACVLPYIAVVIANVAAAPATRAMAPERAIEASPTSPPPPATGSIIQVQELPAHPVSEA